MFRLTDSFQHYTDLTQKFDSLEGPAQPFIAAGLGPRGGDCLEYDCDGRGGATRALPLVVTELFAAFRFRYEGSDGTRGRFFQFVGGTGPTTQGCLSIGVDGYIRARNGNDTVIATASAPLLGFSWTMLWIYYKPDTVSGRFKVWKGNSVILDFTGNTRGANNNNVTAIAFGSGGDSQTGGAKFRYADFAVLDLVAGPDRPNNTFLGDLKINASYPNAAGAYAELTPFPSAPNYDCVNEHPPDGDSTSPPTGTFVEGDSDGLRDAHKFPDVDDGTIYAIANNVCARKTTSGTLELASLFRQNSVDAVGDPASVPDDFHVLQTISEVNPDTGFAWLPAQLNDATAARAQFGYKLIEP